ncbi:MAG: LAGLIDADG family homing endonuclease, partial [Nanoarchaeota archaeon]|nr:LAGLIDADG family homing endonuclease [Nanoarchaeota archaeon]
MEVQEQIQGFQDFIETFLKERLIEQIKKDKRFLLIEASELQKFSPDLIDDLIEHPEDTIKAAEIAIEQFDTLGDVKGFKARFVNLPTSVRTMIREIRAKHLDKLLLVEGTVRQKSDVRPQVISARFECPSCGTLINVLQLDQKFREPSMCGCGRKGKFRLLEKEMVDAQGIVLEEASEDLEGGEQPKRINLLLKNDLVSPISEKRTNPGSRIRVVGILKEIPILAKDGGKMTRFDLMIEANSVDPIEEDFSNLEITSEEAEEIVNLARDPELHSKLVSSVVPSIYGHEKIKEAVLLLMAGGVRKTRDDGSVTRGDIHVLLIGDPGSGKCLHGSTKIMLENGDITRIEEIAAPLPFASGYTAVEGFFVPSVQLDGRLATSQATKVWKRKEEGNLLRIRTRTGKEILATREHPLFYCEQGHIIAKEAWEFSKGERIATPRKVVISGALQTLPAFTPRYARNSHRLTFPAIISEDLARLCGYLCGDGYLAFSKTSGELNITNNDIDTLDDFTRLMRTIFRADVKARKSYVGKTAQERTVNSKSLLEYFSKNFSELLGGAKHKHIPKNILRSRNEVLAEFIKALFECDGHINVKKRQIEFCTISRDLAEEVQYSLFRFGIVSLFKKKLKCATNSKERRMVECYELTVSGEFAEAYLKEIGFLSKRRKDKVMELKSAVTTYNTNIDLIPGINGLLKRIRLGQGWLQKEMGIGRSSYCHFEQDNRLPSVATTKKICEHLRKHGKETDATQLLNKVAHADVFWDEILAIEEVERGDGIVYDLEVAQTHNYVANGVVVHNSAILKRVSKIAPKGRFVSGKGASGAGLCIAPDSLLCTNPGGIEAIGEVVESRLHNPEEVREGIWKQEHITDVKVQSMSPDLKLHSQHPAAIWKLRAPEYLYEITLRSGKRIKMTANTQLFALEDGQAHWKKSCELTEGVFVATPRRLIGGNSHALSPATFIRCNPIVYGVKGIVREAAKELARRYGSLRTAAKELGVQEHALYHYWRKEGARGNITLTDLKKICNAAQMDWIPYVTRVALEKGKSHHLPPSLDKEFLYVAGLIAGDGDIAKKGTSYSVRLSGVEPALHLAYRRMLEKWKLPYDIQLGNAVRPEATRTHSRILAEVLEALGIPPSPKSNRIYFSGALLHLCNDLLAAYIAGIYDTDGSVQARTRGSDCVSFTSTSERFARQLQLVMFRYGVHATIRSRKPSTGRIKGRYLKWEVEIRGAGQIKTFASHFKLHHPQKKATLQKIVEKEVSGNTNVDVLPGIAARIKDALQKEGLALRKVGWHLNLSRDCALRLVRILKHPPAELLTLVESDIYWEPIKKIRKVASESPYVYDLTVKDSHNFVSDGILVHNTAAVVKDEFMNGWSLEAGALVLGNRGVVCIDELDKMSDDDRDAMHEALEGQTVTISKANIQATLRSETTVLAAANPKFGRFDPYEVIPKQIELPSTLINR